MREILERPDFAILELRGGTHLILSKSEEAIQPGRRAPFDLMVDDVDAVHPALRRGRRGCHPHSSAAQSTDSFWITGPSGYRIPVNSSHVEGRCLRFAAATATLRRRQQTSKGVFVELALLAS